MLITEKLNKSRVDAIHQLVIRYNSTAYKVNKQKKKRKRKKFNVKLDECSKRKKKCSVELMNDPMLMQLFSEINQTNHSDRGPVECRTSDTGHDPFRMGLREFYE